MGGRVMKLVIRKYNGDDSYSWAVFRKTDLPKGHRGIVFCSEAEPIVCGCSRDEAKSYKRTLEGGE
jgi:hypothetical protein